MTMIDNIRSSLKFADYYSAYGLDEPEPLAERAVSGNERAEDLIGDYQKRDVDKLCADLVRSFPQL